MSSTITLVDAQGIKKPTVVTYDGLLSDWILENLDNSIPTSIYAGGLRQEFLLATSDEEPSAEEFARLNLHHKNVYIVSSPLGFDPYSILIRVVIAVAVSLITSALTPTPSLPEGTRQPRQSPNNSVGPQTNVSRPNDRVPDVFGEDRCTPDLITAGVFEFVDHVKFIEQDFCISRGFGLIEDVRSGETPGSSISGFQLEIYEPGEAPDQLLRGRESNEVKALTLNAPNDSGIPIDGSYYLNYDSPSTTGFVLSPFDSWDQFTIGSAVNLSQVYYSEGTNVDGSYICDSNVSKLVDLSGLSYLVTTGELEIYGDFSAFSSDDSVFLTGTDANQTLPLGLYSIINADNTELVIAYTGTLVGGTFSGGEASLYSLGVTNPVAINENWTPVSNNQVLVSAGGNVYSPRVFGADENKTRGPFIVPGDDNDQVWVDLQFPRGLVRDGDKSVSVTVRFFFEEIDDNDNPTGPTFNYDQTFTDNEVDPRFYTRKIDNTVPGFIAGKRYRVTGERLSNTNLDDNTLLDQCQWTRLVGIENITAPDTTGTTRIKVNTQATEQTSSLQQSQINLRWTRKCAYWDGMNVIGDVITGVGLVASRRMADNFLTYALDPELGARSPSNIDLETIYEIQEDLDNAFSGEKGEFGFTFSDANTPALEEMRQIANATRCFIYRIGSIISMVRDEPQPLPGTLFNRRNKIPFSERKSQRTNRPLDFDGVQFTYKSRTDDEQKTILIPDDLPPTDPNFGAPPARKYKVAQGTGIRNLSQAWDRAQYEYNKIIYQREQIETSVDEEGILLSLNERIEHTDGTRIYESRSDGEVLGFSGTKVDTSELCLFEPNKTYSVVIRNEDGTVTNAIPVTERPDTAFGFILQTPQSLFTRGTNDYQLGSLYQFSADDDNAKSYLVQSISPNESGEVQLELINYDERYYQADNQIPPEGIE